MNPFKMYSLYKLFKEEKVGTIIINLSTDLKAAGIAAKLAGVKKIIYRRGSAIAIRNTFLNRYLYRKVVTQIIANSKETMRTILQNNSKLIPKSKINIIYNGIDLEEYDNLDDTPIYERKAGEVIIGNAGRLSEEKGQTTLIELAKILKEKNYRFKILIAGKGKLRSKLVKYAKSLGVENEVEFLGFVDNIRSFNRNIDIFVLSSVYEGFGYVLVEAMAAETPVVAFDINSSNEIVNNNYSGLLVEKNNLKELAARVETLIKNPKLRKEYGKNGRSDVEKNFTFSKSLELVEDLILDKK